MQPTASGDDSSDMRNVPVEGSEQYERDAYAANMRKLFCNPGMVDQDTGAILQDHFRPSCVVVVHERNWGESERNLLLQGLRLYGVGQWEKIIQELLPAWDEQQLRTRASKLLGSQSLARHAGWKGDKTAVAAEYERHKRIGEATGCWKNGILVEDDEGSVARWLAEEAAANAKPAAR